jgi:type VI secretion system protein ImpG
MSVVQFQVDPEQAKLSTGHVVERGARLHTRSIAGKDTVCTFRTCYPVTLWPLEVASASVVPSSSVSYGASSGNAAAIIRIGLRCLGGATWEKLKVDKLRFFLKGDPGIVEILYELIFNNAFRVSLAGSGRHGRIIDRTLPGNCIQPVGFGPDEGMLPYPDRSFLGYRLLQEYFCFPWKFLFFDLTGLDQIDRAGLGDQFEIRLFLSPFERKNRLQQLEQTVKAETFQLGCAPAINLFQRLAEPVRLSHNKTEYRILGDIHRQWATEIYSVDQVTAMAPYFEKPREYAPFYSMRHAYDDDPSQAYWYESRRTSEKEGDKGTEVYLSLVDLHFRPTLPAEETLSVGVTCTNRDLAGDLPFSGTFGEISLEGGSMLKVRTVLSPTKPVRPPFRHGLQWRLISHLALNYLSIANGGRDALQEILKLYDFTEDPVIRKQIAGITDVTSASHVTRVISEQGVVFAKGIRVNLQFDEDEYVGGGVFLFASVLERFLGLYSSINSFSQLTVRTLQRKEDLKQWPPRAGEQIIL